MNQFMYIILTHVNAYYVKGEIIISNEDHKLSMQVKSINWKSYFENQQKLFQWTHQIEPEGLHMLQAVFLLFR